MFSYYSPLGRRKSSATSPPLAPASPFLSSLNEAPLPPASPPANSGGSNMSPGRTRSPSRRKSFGRGGLGSPFSTSGNNIGSGFMRRDKAHSSSTTAAAPMGAAFGEGDTPVLASGGSTAPLVARDFALDYSAGKSYPSKGVPEVGSSKAGQGRSGGRGRGGSSDSFFPLYEESDDNALASASSRSPPPGPPPVVGSNSGSGPSDLLANRATSQPPVRRTATQAPSPPVPIAIPPASIHDTYVSNFIQPIAPPSNEGRPSIVRASTAPGVPNIVQPINPTIDTANGESAPTAATGPSGGAGEKDRDGRSQPIFEIFNAELQEDGEKLSHRLRNHLEHVLRGQEEIGRIHLSLEKLSVDHRGPAHEPTSEGAEGEVAEEANERKVRKEEEMLSNREKGVEDIMQRLDSLSNELRTYHDLGTPRLTFHQPASAKERIRSKSIAVAELDLNHERGSDRAHEHTLPSIQDNETSEPRTPTRASHATETSPTTLMRDYTHTRRTPQSAHNHAHGGGGSGAKRRSPLVNTFRPDFETSSSSVSRSSDISLLHAHALAHGGRGNSNLSPLKLDSPESRKHEGGGRRRSWDVNAQRSPEFGLWFDHHHDLQNTPGAGAGGRGGGVDGVGKRVRTITDSPVEMVDRSRF